jgi:rhodanese-related sulfurtransferase
MSMARTAAELVAEARGRVEHLGAEQVRREHAAGAVLVDLREPEERQRTGGIPGAVHAPRGMLEFYADPSSSYHREGFDPARRTILYCASGGRSALAADTLRQLGYTDVAHLDSGFNGWKSAGKPVESVGDGG